jgi:hyperosmotically inducible protein
MDDPNPNRGFMQGTVELSTDPNPKQKPVISVSNDLTTFLRRLNMQTFKKIKAVFFATLLFSCASVFAAPVDDASIQQDIKSKMAADKTVSDLNVQVETRQGVVFLTGVTPTDTEASTVVEIASSTPGVTDVDTSNLKTTKSEHPLNDAFITAKVKGEFVKNKLFGDRPVPVMSVSVETKNGVVFLTGTAETKQQAENAVRLAKAVKGVKRVTSKVTVQ